MIKGLLFTMILAPYFGYSTTNNNSHLLWGSFDEEIESSSADDRYSFWHCAGQQYFENLYNNLGNNQTESTCGYVALAMLLRYYDIFENDSIVASAYEVEGATGESDGTYHEPTNNALTFEPDSVSQYYTFLRSYKNTSLHSYLILYDKDALFNNPPNNYIASTYMGEFGTNEASLASLAVSYLQEMEINQYCTIVNHTSYNTSYSMDDIVDQIINEIYYGRPVICGYQNHAMIVYGYTVDYMGVVRFKAHYGYIDGDPDHNMLVTFVAPSEDVPYQSQVNIGYVSLHFNFNS